MDKNSPPNLNNNIIEPYVFGFNLFAAGKAEPDKIEIKDKSDTKNFKTAISFMFLLYDIRAGWNAGLSLKEKIDKGRLV